MYEVKIDGKSVFKDYNLTPQMFKKMKVYAGDPWYQPLDGKIKNLWVKSCNRNLETFFEKHGNYPLHGKG